LRAGEAPAFPAGAAVLDPDDAPAGPFGVQGATLYVRLPPLDAEDFPARLARAVSLGACGIVLPGTAGSPDIERLAARLAVAEAEAGLADGALRIVASIDHPAGVFGLAALRPHPRLAGLLCDPARLAARLACRPDAPAILQARGLTVLAASACGVPAILTADSAMEAQAAGEEGFAALLVPEASVAA